MQSNVSLAITPQPSRTLLVIPARNEAQTIGHVIEETISTVNCDIIVIDDASTDNTASKARLAGARVLPLALQLGAWGATQTGFRFAVKHGYQTVVTIDADGQHTPQSIPQLLAPLMQGQADVVIGSFPPRGSWQRQMAWHFFKYITDLNLEDLTSGFRAYNQKAIVTLASQEATLLDYQDIGVLLLLQKKGLIITEVETIMNERIEGHSRIFSTWGAVLTYMLHSILLSFSRRNRSFTLKQMITFIAILSRRQKL